MNIFFIYNNFLFLHILIIFCQVSRILSKNNYLILSKIIYKISINSNQHKNMSYLIIQNISKNKNKFIILCFKFLKNFQDFITDKLQPFFSDIHYKIHEFKHNHFIHISSNLHTYIPLNYDTSTLHSIENLSPQLPTNYY